MSSSRREEEAQADELDAEAQEPRHESGFQLKKARGSDAPPTSQPPRSSEPPRKRPSSRPPSRGRWAVVEDFVRDGFRYKVVRRPVPEEGELPVLTPREEEALKHAREGHSNKSIAFILGLAPSTIGVLLYRAAVKLGAKSRVQLLAAYARLKKSLEDDG
jgi:DNA-binding CsgD family transcriptional regulator